jgi:hypothetical protein
MGELVQKAEGPGLGRRTVGLLELPSQPARRDEVALTQGRLEVSREARPLGEELDLLGARLLPARKATRQVCTGRAIVARQRLGLGSEEGQLSQASPL